MAGVIDAEGNYIEEKVHSLTKGTVAAAVRPAVWIDLARIPAFLQHRMKEEIKRIQDSASTSDSRLSMNKPDSFDYPIDGYLFSIPERYAQQIIRPEENDSIIETMNGF